MPSTELAVSVWWLTTPAFTYVHVHDAKKCDGSDCSRARLVKASFPNRVPVLIARVARSLSNRQVLHEPPYRRRRVGEIFASQLDASESPLNSDAF